MNILVFLQTDDSQINRISVESICAAQKLKSVSGCTISAACLSAESVKWAKDKNIDTIYDCTDNNKLLAYHPYRYTDLAEHIINSINPDLIIIGHTYQARDWVPRLSARLDIPFISDCINLNHDGNRTIFTRQVYQGKINQDITSSSNKTIVSIQAGSFNTDTVSYTHLTLPPTPYV